MQAVHPCVIDVLLKLADLLLDVTLERFDIFDVLLLVLLLLHLLLVDFKFAIHNDDVHLVKLDAFAGL